MVKILLFQKIVPSYRLPVFKELFKRNGIITCHSRQRKGSTWRSFHSEMDYPNEFIPRLFYRKSDSAIIQNIFPVLRKYKPKVVIAEYSLANLTFWLLWLLKRFYGYKLIIWGHGIKNHELFSPYTSLSSKLSRRIYNKMDALIIYTEERASIIQKSIRIPEKVFIAQNTLDTRQIKNTYYELKKELHRTDTNFNHKLNILYVGRLIQGKGIKDLLKAFELVNNKYLDIALHIIGEGPEIQLVEQLQTKYKNLYSYGSIYNEEALARKIIRSTVMVNPGYLGLSLVHSLGYGCPVIAYKNSPEGPFHSPEYEYIRDGYNGFFVEHTPEAISEKIEWIIQNPEKTKALKKNSINSINEICPFEKMLQGFGDAIEYVSNK